MSLPARISSSLRGSQDPRAKQREPNSIHLGSPEGLLRRCTLCPRGCGADRTKGGRGYCTTGSGLHIASICLHRGEEPVFSEKGICNVFFAHCNLQCLYCQNRQISANDSPLPEMHIDEAAARIRAILEQGARCVGFVSPSHCLPQMRELMEAVDRAGPRPVYVMNTNCYDRAEAVESLDGEIDVYLPDFKYMDGGLAQRYSGARDYPETALRALREMHRQKGSNLVLDEDGVIRSGLIVRHLVLPGQLENTKLVLRAIAEELSPSVHVSLMAQYYPTDAVRHHPEIGRSITPGEYDVALEEFRRLGFHRGFVQDLGSGENLRPDFTKEDPFS